MTKNNQATVTEINSRRLGRKITMADDVYMSGENHGEKYYGLMSDWKKAIPANEDAAKQTGYYDWYISDERRDDGMSWAEYRDEIIEQLIPVEILDGRKIR